LLASRLLEEQLARSTGQAKHIDSLINWCRCGFLDAMDFKEQTILLLAHRGGLRVEELLRDTPLELVHVHDPDAGFDLVVAGPEPPNRVRAGRLLGPVRIEHGVAKPFQDRRRND
jgi:hypothetical protein